MEKAALWCAMIAEYPAEDLTTNPKHQLFWLLQRCSICREPAHGDAEGRARGNSAGPGPERCVTRVSRGHQGLLIRHCRCARSPLPALQGHRVPTLAIVEFELRRAECVDLERFPSTQIASADGEALYRFKNGMLRPS